MLKLNIKLFIDKLEIVIEKFGKFVLFLFLVALFFATVFYDKSNVIYGISVYGFLLFLAILVFLIISLMILAVIKGVWRLT